MMERLLTLSFRHPVIAFGVALFAAVFIFASVVSTYTVTRQYVGLIGSSGESSSTEKHQVDSKKAVKPIGSTKKRQKSCRDVGKNREN